MKVEYPHIFFPLMFGAIAIVGIICATIADVSKNQKEVPCHESR